MATNRFVLVPEDIYKGFTTTDTGNINLDYSRKMLEKVKREKTNPTIKNARYNQELRRYLHLKKEYEDKPVKVEISGAPIQTGSTTKAAIQQTQNQPTTSKPATQISELSNEFMMRIAANPEKYQVTPEGRIINDHGRLIEGSDIKKSLNWIIANEKGLKAGPRPKGTMNIEKILKKDDVLLQMLQNINPQGLFPSPIGKSTPKTLSFKPRKWQ